MERSHNIVYEWKTTSLKPIEFCKSCLGHFNMITMSSYTQREIEIHKEVAELNKRGQDVDQVIGYPGHWLYRNQVCASPKYSHSIQTDNVQYIV